MAQCRTIAEQKLAQAEHDDRHRRRLIAAAQAWLFLASKLSEEEPATPTQLTGRPLSGTGRGSGPSASGEFWQGRSAGANHSENQPRDTGGDDRHDTISREFFHEQISGIGSY